jgi:hypothetical protein
MIAGILFGFVPLAVWLYLLLFRNGFWLLRERDTQPVQEPAAWPSVVAVVPARNEADVIRESIGSLLAQDYPGSFRIVLVDDQSSDGTGGLARALDSDRLTVLSGTPRPSGWTGKLWAMKQGCDHASANVFDQAARRNFIWFTDATSPMAVHNLRSLVSRAQEGDKVLVSLMARLSCKSYAEHFLIPPLFFLRHAVSLRRRQQSSKSGCRRRRRLHAGAARGAGAGGRAGRHPSQYHRRLRSGPPDEEPRSDLAGTDQSRGEPSPLRASFRYRPYGDPHRLCPARYRRWCCDLAGLTIHLAPVMTALFAWGISQMAGWLAWIIMAVMFQPILRFYRLSPLWGLALPLIGVVYAGFTCQSALQHWSGTGGMWKGRAQAQKAGEQA